MKTLAPIAIQQGSQLLKQQTGKYVPASLQGVANSLIDVGAQQAQNNVSGGSFVGYGMKKRGGSFGGAMIRNFSSMINEDSPVFRQKFIRPKDQS